MEFTDRSRLIRGLCVALVTAVLALALILLVAVCGGDAATAEEETTRRSFVPSLPDEPLDPEDISDIFGTGDWGDITLDPDVTLPPEPDVTLPEWDSGMEWPTLPPTLQTDPDFEWPTLPEGWDTLPEEWSTLPEDWGDIPFDPEDLADLLAGMNGMTGMGAGALAAGLASQLTVMQIYAEREDTLYLKMQSFGNYTGQGWEEAEAYGKGYGNYPYSAMYMPHFLMDEITPFDGYPLVINPKMEVRVMPYFITTTGDLEQVQTSDVKALGAYDLPYTLYYRPYGNYRPASLASGSMPGFEARYAEFVRRGYLDIDDTTLQYLKLIIDEQGFDPADPAIIEKVAAYIQNAAVYNLAYNPNLDREPNVALAFLGAYKEGVCRHYATAATLLYRALGIPARYTVGFMTDVRTGVINEVKGMDAHAWVEVYVDGFGWRYVEVTGSPAGDDPDDPPETETLPDTGGDTLPGTGEGTEPPEEPVTMPSTLGDILAGSNGSLTFSPSIPPAMLNNTVFILTSDGDGRLLLKLRSFGDFTGKTFEAAPYCDVLLYETYSAAYFPGVYLTIKGAPRHTLQVESLMGTYAVPYYVDPTNPAAGITVWDHVVTGDGTKQYTVPYMIYKNDYSSKPLSNLSEEDLRVFARENYMALDEETADYLVGLIVEQKWDQAKETEVVETVAEYLRTHYVLSPDYELTEAPEGNAVLAFLKGEIKGNSRHFAAAATLIYRALGIPARYTVGYLAEGVANTPVTVLGRDAYAWTEVYVIGFGWMAVDVAQRGNVTESNKVTLKPVDMAVPYSGETVEHSGVLEGFEAFAARGFTYEVSVSGRRTGCGVSVVTIDSLRILDVRGQDVTHLFDIEKKTGSLTVYLEALTFRSQDETKVYDGLPVQTHAAALAEGTLPAGYRVEIRPAEGTYTAVGVYYAAYEVVIWYDQENGKAVDRTSWFLIRKEYGTLTVTPAPLTLQAEDARKAYDGLPLTADGIMQVSGTLAEGDTIASYTVEGSRTHVGRSDNTITEIIIRNRKGEDVTGCYAIELLAGTLTVTSS